MDPEIERLMERTRQRRENLQQTLGKTPEITPRKRRTPLSDSLGNVPEQQPHPDDDMEDYQNSPKRRCSREREISIKPDTPAITGVRSRMADLAQERMNWSDVDNTPSAGPVPVPRSSLSQQEAMETSAATPRKSRFAQLASTINSWEDDLSHPTIRKEEEKKPRWQPPSASGTTGASSVKTTAAPPPPSIPQLNEAPRNSPKKHHAPAPPSQTKVSAPKVAEPTSSSMLAAAVAELAREGSARSKVRSPSKPPAPASTRSPSKPSAPASTHSPCKPPAPASVQRSAVDLIPVNARGLNDSVLDGEQTDDEPTHKPVTDRMASWAQKATPTPKGKVGGLAANWEQQVKSATPKPSFRPMPTTHSATPRPGQRPLPVSQNATPLPARSTPVASTARQMCTPLSKAETPQPSNPAASADSDPSLLPVSAKKSLWAERAAGSQKEAEPTAYSVLARMSAWETMSSSQQVSNIKKVDPAAATPSPAPPTPRPLSHAPSPAKSPSKTPVPATPKMTLKDSIAERAAQISTPHTPANDPSKVLSPARASSAMKSVQQRLLEQTQSSNKSLSVAERLRQERMAELASIQNRWKDGVLKDPTGSAESEQLRAPDTPRPIDHDAIKVHAQQDFEKSLAAMGFELTDTDDSASFSFKRGQRSYNQQRREESCQMGQGQPPQSQNSSALAALGTGTAAESAPPLAPSGSPAPPPPPPLPTSQSGSGGFKAPTSQPPRTGSLYKIISQRKEGGAGADHGAMGAGPKHPQTVPASPGIRKRVQFDDSFDSTEGSEISEVPTEGSADIESSEDGTASSSRPSDLRRQSAESEGFDTEEEKFQPARRFDDSDSDDSLSAFVPAAVRRQSILPSPHDKSKPSDSDSFEEDRRPVDHSRSSSNLHRLGQESRLHGNVVRVEGEEVCHPVHEYRVKVVLRRKQTSEPSSDDDSDNDDKAAIDDLLDEAMDEEEEEVVLRHPHKRPTADSGTEPGNPDLEEEANRHNYTSAPASSSEGNHPLPYSIHSFRNSQNVERQVQARIVRNSEYTSQPVAEENIEMPHQAPAPRKTIQERIQELQELVHQEQSIIMQTSNALNQCCSSDSYFAGSVEQVECNRLLLLACQKRQSYLLEIQRLKDTGQLDPHGTGQHGSLTISDIRLPLKRDFVTKIGTAQDTCVYHFIVLIRNGPQVICTQLLSTHDPMMRGSLDFPNLIKINGIAADFNLPLEIYGMSVSREPLGKDKKKKTPKKMKTLRPRESPGGPMAVHTTSFSLITSITLTRRCVDKTQFTLDRLPYLSPLHGTIFLRLKCLMETNVKERGFLTMFEDVSGLGAWHRRWCVLSGNKLCYWKYPDDEQRKEPMGYIDLKRCITEKVGLIPRDICARPNTFELMTVRQPRKGEEDTLITKRFNTMTTIKYMLCADTKEERIVWCNKVNTALRNLRTWHPDALRPVSLPTTS